MTSRTAHRWIRHPLLAALLLAAFCARALIPAGYMPGDGGLILCPAFAPVIDRGGEHGAHHGMNHDMPHDAAGESSPGGTPPAQDLAALCPFAAASAAMATPSAMPVVVGIASAASRVALPRPVFVPRAVVVPTRLPRGPPIFA